MAPELSNWEKLQAKLKANPAPAGPAPSTLKRKAEAASKAPSSKKQKKQKQAAPLPKKTIIGTASKSKVRLPNLAGRMGAGQSSTVDLGTGPSPSLSTWAADNDISAESLAEAYGLGLKDNSLLTSEKERENAGLAEGVEVGKYIAIDCEMVGVGEGGHESALARASVVDFHGRQIYDSYVKPKERVTDWRSAVSGITQKHMRFARDFDEVQTDIAELLKDRILVGHDVKHDLDALLLTHPIMDLRDTAKHPGFRKYGNGKKPALARLSSEILGVEIQKGAHSSIEDAKVTMALFRKFKPAFDLDHSNRFPSLATRAGKGKSDSKKPKKKRK
ncbi:ribonuclease H-like domain-containing protein [Plectosphaerella plurivora]|uniref:RNA exonuclease 4 n=1 Tax=Plectosphaerella plurivora TaxID=936078 RepID=A0A9P8V3N5_9PEZI|nr:ribonuclease H-like domain-containing protein [Plectosphaerella plurivora]